MSLYDIFTIVCMLVFRKRFIDYINKLFCIFIEKNIILLKQSVIRVRFNAGVEINCFFFQIAAPFKTFILYLVCLHIIIKHVLIHF